LSYWMTSVWSSGALNLTACEMNGASAAVAPALYFMTRLPVHTASLAVSGRPSDQKPGLTLKVQVLPSFDVVQDFAQSPSMATCPGPVWRYCTSVGYCMMNASYDCAE